MLGRAVGGRIEPATFGVSAHANRVAVENGHTICMTVELDSRASAEDCARVLAEWEGDPSARGLPSSPDRPIIVDPRSDRPQPRRDVASDRGMAVTVGRVRPDTLLDIRFVTLSHNTIRGAAGASLLNAEVLSERGAFAS